MTIENLLIAGAVAGFLIGLFTPSMKIGCAVLWGIPIAMIVYIAVWQGLHPESIRSTSSLDFIFGPLWPSLGGLGGYSLGKLIRSVIANKLHGG